jgi:hypothetical protein
MFLFWYGLVPLLPRVEQRKVSHFRVRDLRRPRALGCFGRSRHKLTA